MKVLIAIPAELRDVARVQFDALSTSGSAGPTFERGANATGIASDPATHYVSAPVAGPETLAALPTLKAAFPGSDYWLPPDGTWSTEAALAWLQQAHSLFPVE